MTRYYRGNNVTSIPTPAVDKGKGKVEEVEDDDDDDNEEEEDEMDEDEDEDDVSQAQILQLPPPTKSGSSQDEDFDAIDPAAVLPPGRRTRGVKVDYTSSEALRKAGLKPEDDAEEEGEDSFTHDDDAMKH